MKGSRKPWLLLGLALILDIIDKGALQPQEQLTSLAAKAQNF